MWRLSSKRVCPPTGLRLIRLAVTAPCRLRHRVSRPASFSRRAKPAVSTPPTEKLARLKHLLLAAPRCDPEGLLKLIKEDHFACTTRMFEILGILLPGPRQYTGAPELTSSRLPTIHLSKSCVTKVLRRLTLRGSATQNFFSQPSQVSPRRLHPFG